MLQMAIPITMIDSSGFCCYYIVVLSVNDDGFALQDKPTSAIPTVVVNATY